MNWSGLRPVVHRFALLNDPDFLNQIVTRYLQQFLEAEIATFLQAEPYQRTEDRTGYRNGYKPRIVKTRVGRIELSVPQDREGRFHSGLFARFQRSEKALILALQEAYLQGVSTRKVTKITEQLCGTSFSKSQVSDLCQEIDADIKAWRERPLEQAYPYLIIDATYLYIRSAGQVVSEGVLIVSGIAGSGPRRRADVVQIFPNEQACERLIGALCMEWSDEWISGRRYLDMTYLK